MPAPVTTYSPKLVTLIISGYQIASIVSLSLAWTTPPFRLVPGIRGKSTRVRNTNSSGVLSVELLQTAIANDVFDQLIQADVSGGQAMLTVTLEDLSGRLKLQSNQAYIQNRPQIEFSNSSNNRVWEIAMLQIEDKDLAGSGNTLASLFDLVSKRAEDAVDSLVEDLF